MTDAPGVVAENVPLRQPLVVAPNRFRRPILWRQGRARITLLAAALFELATRCRYRGPRSMSGNQIRPA